VSRIDGLILAGADPGADDISKAAMLKTIGGRTRSISEYGERGKDMSVAKENK
jgi:hypothetical protein